MPENYSIQLPERFIEKLHPSVIGMLTSNSPDSFLRYYETDPYYFKEYTAHGAKHISAVLEYAVKLIPKEQYESLNSDSITVLVLGIFLHDLGMFIKESGLKKLLEIERKDIYIAEKKQYYSWKELWDEHIKKLKRCPGNELEEIFGNQTPVFDISSHEVCGTFIRKYHHEIANYIANNGFPGEKNHSIMDEVKSLRNGDKLVKLIGVLAKSHGIAMRDMDKDIDSFGYKNNLPLDIPIYYLIAVLRLADLLDADENRAPKIIADMNTFSSARSQSEWNLNGLIENKQWADSNGEPETLWIIATPVGSKQYLELKSWFEYWQKELDLSWAVMGEKHRDAYKLSIRRISSNIFENEYDFVKRPIELRVNPDLVKLLVAPLYGDDPSYGVRELLQNAIDACNERTAIDGTSGEIIIDINENTGLFTISDNGIGMNEDIIANYYLTAGASYRYSKQWAETFLDSENNAKIARSGRFGIGALATFLIGNQAKVITRNINDARGYCFEYTIEPKILNVSKIDKTEPGTIIEITMNQKAIDTFVKTYWYGHGWSDWYHFTEPNIIYILNGKELKKEEMFNLRKGEDSNNWFACHSNEYDSLHWSVKHYVRGKYMCNGIHIPNEQGYYYRDTPLRASLIKRGYYAKEPTISVIDKRGIFPLDLARKIVFDTFTLDDNVVVELCKYQIARLLIYGPTAKCIINKNGFIPKERSFVLNIERPVYLVGKASASFEVVTNSQQHDIAIGYFTADKKTYVTNIKEEIVGDDLARRSTVTEIWANNKVIEIPKTVRYLPPINMVHSIDDTIEWYNNIQIPVPFIEKNVNLIVKYIPTPIQKDENNIMFNVVKEFLPKHINGGWIPFDEKERERLYCETYKKLKRYIEPLKAEKKKKRHKR